MQRTKKISQKDSGFVSIMVVGIIAGGDSAGEATTRRVPEQPAFIGRIRLKAGCSGPHPGPRQLLRQPNRVHHALTALKYPRTPPLQVAHQTRLSLIEAWQKKDLFLR